MSPRSVTVAAIQTSYGPDQRDNIARTMAFVREAAKRGAQIVLPSELFEGIYFCTSQNPKWFETARAPHEHPCVIALKKLAKELKVVIPISFFEKDGPRYYNSIAIADTDGAMLCLPGLEAGIAGPEIILLLVSGAIGNVALAVDAKNVTIGICWDQWYPECARAMVLQGAEILFYPTAIGSEPYDANLNTHKPWQRAMQGHAVANAVPIIAANRIGLEDNAGIKQKFYGHSFITDHSGELLQHCNDTDEGVLVQAFDLNEIESYRADWGFFRDRRTDLYAKSIV